MADHRKAERAEMSPDNSCHESLLSEGTANEQIDAKLQKVTRSGKAISVTCVKANCTQYNEIFTSVSAKHCT